MKILVRHGRVDPVVTSQSNNPQQMMQEEITESELNSEVELLNSRDLLRKVVLANGLQTRQRSWLRAFRKPNEEVVIAKAVRDLGKRLKVEPCPQDQHHLCNVCSPPILIWPPGY